MPIPTETPASARDAPATANPIIATAIKRSFLISIVLTGLPLQIFNFPAEAKFLKNLKLGTLKTLASSG
jgi:hypothetical protein